MEFPKGFYWGSATSSHQVEGNNHNNWSEWEKKNAKLKMQNAKLRKWPDYILERYPNPLQEENYISGRACDHYNRFREDFDIAKFLGHNAHRFSIEWSRIEPEEGKFDEKEIEHYRQVIRALRERDIEPFVTLWHWTNPIWFSKKGGWLNKNTPRYFERYVSKIVESLGDEIRFWITINEPLVVASNAFLKGIWPPQEKSFFKWRKVLNNLAEAHRLAYRTIHRNYPGTQVGISKHNVYFEGWPISALAGWVWNKNFLNRIKNYQDFIGLNYYFHNRIKGLKFNQNENEEVNDMGWEICPQGIYHLLKNLEKYNKPIYITENGLADAKDEKREKFIKKHLRYVHKAVEEGVDVRGYFHWSLLDNFEWDYGFWPRFGLVEMNYQTMERKIRPSALKYKEIVVNNSLDI